MYEYRLRVSLHLFFSYVHLSSTRLPGIDYTHVTGIVLSSRGRAPHQGGSPAALWTSGSLGKKLIFTFSNLD